MAGQDLGRNKIASNLQDAIVRLQEDVSRVELWASALSCFAKPIPDYEPGHDFALPQAKPGTAYEPLPREQRYFR